MDASRKSSSLTRHAFRESKGFLALLLIGAPALYSVEAYFTALNTALSGKENIQWLPSILFSLIFLTFNIRFINGNYDHIRNPQWVDADRGTVNFAYLIDVCAVIFLHAILVVMASRTFINESSVTVGQELRTGATFYCPGFFACLTTLLFADILWLFYKMSSRFCISLVDNNAWKWKKGLAFSTFVNQFRGVYASSNSTWLVVNAVSLLILCLGTLLHIGYKDLPQTSAADFAVKLVSDSTHTSSWMQLWLISLSVGAFIAAGIDLGSTSIGPKAQRDLSLMTSLGSLFKKASLVSREAQNASTQAKASVPGTMFSGEFPFGWMVEIAGDKLFVFACATNDNIDRSDLTDRVSAELDQHKATIISTKKVRIYCLVRPKHSDLTSIQLKLIKLAEEAKKAPTELTAEICWLEDFHFEERKSINLPFVDRISTRSLNLNEILNQEDLIKEFEECMEEIDACVSELKMTSAWVDL